MSKRDPVSKRTRFEIFKRDGFVCQYCGAHPPEVLLHCDHIHPVAEGGSSDPDNLITACEACNQGKGAVPLSAVPDGLAERAARVAESEAQIAGYSAVIRARRERVEQDVWRVVEALNGEQEVRRDWFRSVQQFVEKLGAESTIDAAEIARGAKPWSERQRFLYFCGICWNMIRRGAGDV